MIPRSHRSWQKSTRVTARDGLSRFCLGSIATFDERYDAVRIVPCKAKRGHTGKHRNPRAGTWTDEDAATMDRLRKDYRLRSLGLPPPRRRSEIMRTQRAGVDRTRQRAPQQP